MLFCQSFTIGPPLASGVAKPGPTQALAQASAHLTLASEIDDDHMINLYFITVSGVTGPTISLCGPPSVFQLIM